ncbi:MAG: LysR substrate-binding domain-containing protein [Gammaproteobacteria bacterium]|nr:LysR substrate-binding domain-containing protein [Gammaproteobacteria bacterium]
MKITFRQIDAFKRVVQTGSVTESARILGISQPAVSRLLSDLETQVGFQLFSRSGRNLKATPEALLLVEEVRRALSGLEQIKHTAAAIKNFKHAQLRLISTPAFSTLIAPQLIRQFAARQPAAMVSLEIQSIDVALEWMVSQNFDFGIAPATLVNPAIMSHSLTDTQSICVLPKGHRLEAKESIEPGDLDGESFVSYLPDSQFRFEVDEIFSKAGIQRRLQYEARTTDAICRLVAQGLGVSIIVTMGTGSAAGEDFSTAPFAREIPFNGALIWSQQKAMSAVAKDFLKMVETEFSSMPARS